MRIGIIAHMGYGLEDRVSYIHIPDEGELDVFPEEIDGEPMKYKCYAVYDKCVVYECDKSNYGTAVCIVKEKDIPSDTDQHLTEYAALWAPNRKEWIGIIVKRTRWHEGIWQGLDESVSPCGPFKLGEVWKKRILEAYKTTEFIDALDVLHAEPLKLVKLY